MFKNYSNVSQLFIHSEVISNNQRAPQFNKVLIDEWRTYNSYIDGKKNFYNLANEKSYDFLESQHSVTSSGEKVFILAHLHKSLSPSCKVSGPVVCESIKKNSKRRDFFTLLICFFLHISIPIFTQLYLKICFQETKDYVYECRHELQQFLVGFNPSFFK